MFENTNFHWQVVLHCSVLSGSQEVEGDNIPVWESATERTECLEGLQVTPETSTGPVQGQSKSYFYKSNKTHSAKACVIMHVLLSYA